MTQKMQKGSGVQPEVRTNLMNRVISSNRYPDSFKLYYDLLKGSEDLIKTGASFPTSMDELRGVAVKHDNRIQTLTDGRLHFFQQQTGRYGERMMTPYDRAQDPKDATDMMKVMALYKHNPRAMVVVDLIGAPGSPIEDKVRYVGPAAFAANFLMVGGTLAFPKTEEQKKAEPDFILISNPYDPKGRLLLLTEERVGMYESQIYTGDHKKAHFRMYWDAIYHIGYLPLHAAHGITESGKGIAVNGPSGTGKSTIIFNLAKTLVSDDCCNFSPSSGNGHMFESGSYAKTEGVKPGNFLYDILADPRVILENVALTAENNARGVDYSDVAMFGKNGRAGIPFDAFPTFKALPTIPINAIVFVNRNDFDPPVTVSYMPGGNPLNAMLGFTWIEAASTGAAKTSGMDAGATTDFRPNVGEQDIPRLRDVLESEGGKNLVIIEANTGAVESTKIRVNDTTSAINAVLNGTAVLEDHPFRPGAKYVHSAPGIEDDYMHQLRPFDVAAGPAKRGFAAKLERARQYMEKIRAPEELRAFADQLLAEAARK